MNRSTPGLPVHHKSPESTQIHAHQVDDAIQPSHPLSSPSPPYPNPSQHQGLFQWVNSSHEVAKVLEFQSQNQSFQWTPRTYLLQDGLVGSPCSLRDAQESSPTPQFKSINFLGLKFLTVQLSHPYMTTGGWRRAERSYSMFKVRRGSLEKIPLIQAKEQRLHFAGAAVKRYPTYKVRETQDMLVYSKKEMTVN